jgi:hypothetical protein
MVACCHVVTFVADVPVYVVIDCVLLLLLTSTDVEMTWDATAGDRAGKMRCRKGGKNKNW